MPPCCSRDSRRPVTLEGVDVTPRDCDSFHMRLRAQLIARGRRSVRGPAPVRLHAARPRVLLMALVLAHTFGAACSPGSEPVASSASATVERAGESATAPTVDVSAVPSAASSTPPESLASTPRLVGRWRCTPIDVGVGVLKGEDWEIGSGPSASEGTIVIHHYNANAPGQWRTEGTWALRGDDLEILDQTAALRPELGEPARRTVTIRFLDRDTIRADLGRRCARLPADFPPGPPSRAAGTLPPMGPGPHTLFPRRK
jgi:hypothetical protein